MELAAAENCRRLAPACWTLDSGPGSDFIVRAHRLAVVEGLGPLGRRSPCEGRRARPTPVPPHYVHTALTSASLMSECRVPVVPRSRVCRTMPRRSAGCVSKGIHCVLLSFCNPSLSFLGGSVARGLRTDVCFMHAPAFRHVGAIK